MKIRNGFVSNSSSSSFVVASPKKLKTIEVIKEVLFPTEETFVDPYEHYSFSPEHAHHSESCICGAVLVRGHESWPISEICDIILNEVKEQKPNNKKAIIDGFSGWYEGIPDYDNFELPTGETDWVSYHKSELKCRKRLAEKFIKDNPNSYIYVFEFSDNDGSLYQSLEHGNTFYNVPHVKISRH